MSFRMEKEIIEKEIIDIVDENDKVIGQEERWEAKRRGLKHRAVDVWIVNREGKILLQKRQKDKKIHPDKYSSAASGGINAGESYEEAAHRELKEEVGIDVKLKKVGKIESYDDSHREYTEDIFITLFLGKYDKEDFAINKREVQHVKFFTIKEIEELIKCGKTEPKLVKLLKLYKKRLAENEPKRTERHSR